MFKLIKKWRRPRAVKSLRRELLRWGVDTSHLTDDELARRIVYAGKLIADCGLTWKELADSLYLIGTASKKLVEIKK